MKRIDLTGKTFGKWRVLYYVGGSSQWYWLCICTSCGDKKNVAGSSLRGEYTRKCKSCGGKNNSNSLVHGLVGTKLYKSWGALKERALQHTAANSHLYIAKGITVDPLWESDFVEFYNDMASTWFAGACLHRIDPYAGYFKENCVWLNKSDHSKIHRQLKREGVYNGQ